MSSSPEPGYYGMRKVVLYSLMSLNGVAEHVDRFVPEFDEVMDAHLARTTATQDAVLLGRRTYDDWAAYWPTADDPFAAFINKVRKYAFTTDPPADGWTGTTFVTGNAAQAVREMKDHPGGDIGVHGSIRLAQALLAADLIDEVRLVITPVVAGNGRQLFPPGDDRFRHLHLVRAESTPSGALLADYVVAKHTT